MKACEERNIKFMKLKYRIPSTATTREERRNKSDFGNHNMDWIGYADDLVLVFVDTDNLQNGLDTLNETFERYHLTINVTKTKTKTMFFNYHYINDDRTNSDILGMR